MRKEISHTHIHAVRNDSMWLSNFFRTLRFSVSKGKEIALAGLFIAFLIAVSSPVHAQSNQDAAMVSALKNIEKDRWTKGREALGTDPRQFSGRLYQWLFYTRIDRDLDEEEFLDLVDFVNANEDWPNQRDLRLKIEDNMPTSYPDARIIEWFAKHEPLTVRGTDMYLDALRRKGREIDLKAFLSDWWANTLIPRNDQKFLYSKYKAYITDDAHEKRIDALLLSRQYTNARAIANVLGRGFPQLVEARIALAENKGGVNAAIERVPAHLRNNPGLVYERLHWRRQRDLNDRAIEILKNPPPADQIVNKKDWWRERHIIIRRLLEKKDYNTAYELAAGHIQGNSGFPFAQAEWLAGWIALRFLNKPFLAFEHFQTLHKNVSTPVSKSRAAYWGARAAEAAGQANVFGPWYQEAAKYQTTFYGQLASARLSLRDVQLGRPPPVLEQADLAQLNAHDLVRGARLFHAAGMTSDARNFLKAFARAAETPKAFRFAAEFAAELQYYDEAVRIAKDASHQGMFLTAQSYPVIAERLRGIGLDWSLVHALIRQESQFDVDARSSAGALGMMQLLPSTAKLVAKQNRISYHQSKLTTDPNYNIRLGSLFMADLLKRYDWSYPLAIAAYNAGPGRVNEWLKIYGDPRKGEIDMIDFIELMPFYETRNYVQRVLENTYVYRLRLKGKMPSTNLGKLHIDI